MVERQNKDSLFFEGRIKEIEQELIRYQIDLARSNSQSISLQKIMTVLTLHGRLTQSQIKQLAILSKSTISTGLLNLVNLGHVSKEKIQGSREYVYCLSNVYKASMSNALGSLEREIQFFEGKLVHLNTSYSSDYRGFTLLKNRLIEIIRVFSLYQKILEKFDDNTIQIKNEDDISSLTKDDIENINEFFDSEIKEVEDEIIHFFVYNSAYSTLDEFFLRSYAYFLTRRVLTQERLRALTGLSFGKISQIINDLLDVQLIEKLNKKETSSIIPHEKKRQQFYTLISIQKSFFRSALNSGKKMLQSKTKFGEMRKELVNNKTMLKKLNGYENVLEFLDNYFKLVSIIEDVGHLFEGFS